MQHLVVVNAGQLEDLVEYEAIQEKARDIRRDVLAKFAAICMKNFEQLDAFAQRAILGTSIYAEVRKQQG